MHTHKPQMHTRDTLMHPCKCTVTHTDTQIHESIHTETHMCTALPSAHPPAPLWLREGLSGGRRCVLWVGRQAVRRDGVGLLHL